MQSTPFLWLSYPLNSRTPGYAGGPGLEVQILRSLAQGDSSNNSHWSFPNHLGSHLDAPRHFAMDGLTIDRLPPEFFVFHHVQVVEPVIPGNLLLGPDQLGKDLRRETELLLIKTGFGKYRHTSRYWREGPGMLPESAEFLRESCPDLRVVGFDFISLTSLPHRELGRKAHRAFLTGNRPLLPLEDLDLRGVDSRTRFRRVTVLPLRVENSDGAPVTILAETETA